MINFVSSVFGINHIINQYTSGCLKGVCNSGVPLHTLGQIDRPSLISGPN